MAEQQLCVRPLPRAIQWFEGVSCQHPAPIETTALGDPHSTTGCNGCGSHWHDRLVASLVATAPERAARPRTLTLDEMIALVRPYVVLAHPDAVEQLQAEADARGLAVDVWAPPWAEDPDVAYLIDRRALQVREAP